MLDCPTAAVMRNGLVEMKNFCLEFFETSKAETFFQESAGIADLMTSCMSRNPCCLSMVSDASITIPGMGGRNRNCAEVSRLSATLVIPRSCLFRFAGIRQNRKSEITKVRDPLPVANCSVN
jgi:hypothetical protein